MSIDVGGGDPSFVKDTLSSALPGFAADRLACVGRLAFDDLIWQVQLRMLPPPLQQLFDGPRGSRQHVTSNSSLLAYLVPLRIDTDVAASAQTAIEFWEGWRGPRWNRGARITVSFVSHACRCVSALASVRAGDRCAASFP